MKLSASLSTALTVRTSGVSHNQVFDEYVRDDFLEDEVLQVVAGVAGNSTQAVNLGTLATARTLLVMSDQALVMTVNGTAALTAKFLALDVTTVTSLSLTNSGSVAANVKIIALGA